MHFSRSRSKKTSATFLGRCNFEPEAVGNKWSVVDPCWQLAKIGCNLMPTFFYCFSAFGDARKPMPFQGHSRDQLFVDLLKFALIYWLLSSSWIIYVNVRFCFVGFGIALIWTWSEGLSVCTEGQLCQNVIKIHSVYII